MRRILHGLPKAIGCTVRVVTVAAHSAMTLGTVIVPLGYFAVNAEMAQLRLDFQASQHALNACLDKNPDSDNGVCDRVEAEALRTFQVFKGLQYAFDHPWEAQMYVREHPREIIDLIRGGPGG